MSFRPAWLTLTLAVSACGGGAPLLHPAHALAAGHTRFGAGVDDRVLFGSSQSALQRARAAQDGVGPGALDAAAFARAALVEVAQGPRLSPWVGARAGLSGGYEAGLAYTGRGARLDARRAFEWGSWALSIGAAASARPSAGGSDDLGPRGHSDSGIPGLDPSSVSGYGFDLPVLFGYRSSPNVVALWAGARLGLDRWRGDLGLAVDADPNARRRGEFDATHAYGAALLGAQVGIAPIRAAIELELSLSHTSGHVEVTPGDRLSLEVDGVALAPAGALIAEF